MSAKRRLWTHLAIIASALAGTACRIGFDLLPLDDGATSDAYVAPPTTRKLVMGWQHACVIETNGLLRCWGDNSSAQIGIGVGPDADVPTIVEPFRAHARVGLGQNFSCALDTGGVIRCWGSDEYGELGRTPLVCGNSSDNPPDEQCDDGNTANGDGCDSLCQNGAGPPPLAPAPVALDGPRRYRELFTKRFSSCGITVDGALLCWGRNGARQLGVGDSVDRGRPEQVLIKTPEVGDDKAWASVAVGSDHMCALQADGSLWCWGGDGFGQLAQGVDPYIRAQPNLVPDGSRWLAVESGNDFSCGIKTDQTLWCWGLNSSYQLGLGDTTNRDVPVQVLAGTFTHVGLGPSSACARSAAGSVYCWGANVAGETGQPAGTPTMIPLAIAGTWIDVKGGASFTCLMAANEDVYCMGTGSNGRLGDGTGASTTTPVRVLL